MNIVLGEKIRADQSQISFFRYESQNITSVHFKNGGYLLIKKPLITFAREFPPSSFQMFNDRYLINLNHVSNYKKLEKCITLSNTFKINLKS
ncbi:LytTR family transcriptional regulator DNA-binding domain-containing protein [Lacihabitans lacunae]|uniref:LytTR family transcriptional regulator DNA-binding domain-containing protein n=1 Tax=Lacihabitans lacunae TaxID=1028214 RepID=A0ABV7Z3N1_9BACT